MLSRGVISSAKGMIPDISKVGYPMCCYRLHQINSAVIAENDNNNNNNNNKFYWKLENN